MAARVVRRRIGMRDLPFARRRRGRSSMDPPILPAVSPTLDRAFWVNDRKVSLKAGFGKRSRSGGSGNVPFLLAGETFSRVCFSSGCTTRKRWEVAMNDDHGERRRRNLSQILTDAVAAAFAIAAGQTRGIDREDEQGEGPRGAAGHDGRPPVTLP